MAEGVDSTTVWRTCIGCRERASTTDLVRVVAVPTSDGFVATPDRRRSLPGRGAHLHPDPACLDLARRRKAFGRSLRSEGPFDLHLLEELLQDHSTT